MFNHAPENYDNPFKAVFVDGDLATDRSRDADVFYHDDKITAFIAAGRWPKNGGNALIVPNEYYENLYDIPDELLAYIHIFSKKLAIAMKEVYGCDGVSIRQHNEPAGDQTVWHYHLHVFPRYHGDELYASHKQVQEATLEERAEFATKLRNYFDNK